MNCKTKRGFSILRAPWCAWWNILMMEQLRTRSQSVVREGVASQVDWRKFIRFFVKCQELF